MSANADLTAAYREWRQWSEVEGESICSGNWPRVAECQGAKQQLQRRIIQLGEAARIEWSRLGAAGAEQERAMRSTVGELIQLETRNGNILAVRRETMLAQQAELGRSQNNLQRIRRSYAPARKAAWSSFS